MKKLTESNKLGIRDMYLQGITADDIATKYGIHKVTVYGVLEELRVPRRRARKGYLTDADVQVLKAAFETGDSYEKLAKKFGVSYATVSKYLKRAGVAPRPAGFRRGADHHAWVGGRHVTEDGYVRVWLTSDDPFYGMAQRHSKNGGYILEHRLVMARSLGRPLADHETVHHIDGDKQNNHFSNLQLRQGRHGKGSVLVCADCGSHNLIHAPLESN